MSPLLKGHLTLDALFRIDIVGILITTIGTGYEFYYQIRLRQNLAPWATARRHAESLRSAVWLYLFDLLPSSLPVSDAATDAAWQAVAAPLTTKFPQAPSPAAEPAPRLQELRGRLRQLSLAGRVQAYCTARLDSQRQYFDRRADELCATANFWQRTIYWLLGIAIGWNILRLVALLAHWQGAHPFFSFNVFVILVYAIGLAKAYIESEDMGALSTRYKLMHDNLLAHSRQSPREPLSAAAVSQFVQDSERILRNETAEWATRRLELAQDITVGFVGKRLLPEGEGALRATLMQLFDQLETEYSGPAHELVGLSALALGADLVFADVVAQRGATAPTDGQPGYAQRVFLPAPPTEFFLPADFRLTDAEPDSAVQARLARAAAYQHGPVVREVCVVSTSTTRDERFAETAFAIADASDLLLVACTHDEKVAVLSSSPALGFARGGSAETLRYARNRGKRLVIIELDGPVGPDGQLPVTQIASRLSQPA
jgi:hypothetical protein